MDLSQIVAMARECGCYQLLPDGKMLLCPICYKMAKEVDL